MTSASHKAPYVVSLQGAITKTNLQQTQSSLHAPLTYQGPVHVDLQAVQKIDSAGIALLLQFHRQRQKLPWPCLWQNINHNLQHSLALFPMPHPQALKNNPNQGSFLEYIGGIFWYIFLYLKSYQKLWTTLLKDFYRCLQGHYLFRWPTIINEMSQTGSKALGIIALISWLLGLTIALQSIGQLKKLGAEIFVPDLMAVSIARELGPLIAAIVVAGRTGSAIAAEIATMVVTEEWDALRIMGLSPIRFVILPKIIALSLMLPLLNILACLIAIFGGYTIAASYLDMPWLTFFFRVQQAVVLKDIVSGLFKSFLFANLIVSTGALHGMRTHGGADAVGHSTTQAVVTGIFAIIVADAFCSMLFYFGN